MLHDRRTSLILLAATSLLGSALLSGCGAMADTWERGLPMPGFSVTGGTAGEDPGKDYVPSMEVDPAKLVGGWEEPVPGQPGRFQGYRLNKDGTASSINMATLTSTAGASRATSSRSTATASGTASRSPSRWST